MYSQDDKGGNFLHVEEIKYVLQITFCQEIDIFWERAICADATGRGRMMMNISVANLIMTMRRAQSRALALPSDVVNGDRRKRRREGTSPS